MENVGNTLRRKSNILFVYDKDANKINLWLGYKSSKINQVLKVYTSSPEPLRIISPMSHIRIVA